MLAYYWQVFTCNSIHISPIMTFRSHKYNIYAIFHLVWYSYHLAADAICMYDTYIWDSVNGSFISGMWYCWVVQLVHHCPSSCMSKNQDAQQKLLDNIYNNLGFINDAFPSNVGEDKYGVVWCNGQFMSGE